MTPRQANGLVFFFCTVLVCASHAQVMTFNNSTATPVPGSDRNYIKLLSETVDPASGSLSIRVNVPVPKGRGPTLPFSFAYDSGSALFPANLGTNTWQTALNGPLFLTRGGWGYTLPQSIHTLIQVQIPGIRNITCLYTDYYIMQDSLGTRHSLGLGTAASNGNYNCGADFLTATDGVYSGQLGPSVVADPDGTVYRFGNQSYNINNAKIFVTIPDVIEDRNGNTLSTTSASNGSFTVTDTLGRALLTSSGFAASGNTVAVAGLTSPYSVTWGTTSANFSVTATTIHADNINCSFPLSFSASGIPVITAITLPNNEKYQFQYDGVYGLVNKIIYPSGGYVRYAWGLNPKAAVVQFPSPPPPDNGVCDYEYDKPSILHRYVSFDGTTEVLQQDFKFSPTAWSSDPVASGWTSKQTTVTTKDMVRGQSFQTVYTYAGVTAGGPVYPLSRFFVDVQIPQETNVVYKDWSGSVLKTVSKVWHDLFVISSEQDTLGSSGPTSKVAFTYGPGDQVTEKDEYDYGQTSPTRKTLTAYQPFAATPIFSSGPSIFDRPKSTIVYDASGTRVAETDYAYDETAVTSVTAIEHDDTNYPATKQAPRGNLTTKTQKCFPISPATGSCSDAVTTYKYDDTGQTISSIDPNGNISTFSYADNFTNGTPPGNTNAYLTSITYPKTGSVQHAESFSYDYGSGQLSGVTDQNKFSTTYSYADPFARLTEIDYPAQIVNGTALSGSTKYAYTDTAGAVSIQDTKLQDQVNSVVNTTYYDGMGHPTSTRLLDPEGDVLTATIYDGEGRVASVSNPYRSLSEATYGITSTQYDAVGRVLQVTHPDGSKTVTTYSGRAAQVQDEGNGTSSVGRILQSNALGQLTSVCELTSATQAGGNSPVLCNLDIGTTTAKGFLTNYQYDGLGDLTTVNQSAETRSFSYDSLSRLLSATNPESGTTTYTYDNNSNVRTRTRPAPNQSSPNVTVTTTYQYDALDRLKSTTYSDQTTPSVSRHYDTTSELGLGLSNTIGRLSAEYTTNSSGAVISGRVYNYDPLGHVLDNSQCTPQNCSKTTAWSLTYGFDLLGKPLSATNGKGTTFNYTFDAAARLTQLTSSLSDKNHPGSLFSGATYSAFGSPTGGSVANALNEVLAYDCRGRTLAYVSAVPPAQPSLSGITNTPGCSNSIGAIYHAPGDGLPSFWPTLPVVARDWETFRLPGVRPTRPSNPAVLVNPFRVRMEDVQ